LLEDLTMILVNIVFNLGYTGLFIVMFLAGFCVPIPWELVLISVGASELDPLFSSLLCGLGSSFGAVMGYLFGKCLGRPLIMKHERYLFVSNAAIERAERWILKWGNLATITCRSIQYLPYKTFSITAGILNMNIYSYTALTVLGSIIRCLYMVYAGRIISVNLNLLFLIIITSLVVGFLIIYKTFR